jgi:hypothetical protein
MTAKKLPFNDWFEEVKTCNSYCGYPLGEFNGKLINDFKILYEGGYTVLEAVVIETKKLKPEAVVV